jgi:hypothetical protein
LTLDVIIERIRILVVVERIFILIFVNITIIGVVIVVLWMPAVMSVLSPFAHESNAPRLSSEFRSALLLFAYDPSSAYSITKTVHAG